MVKSISNIAWGLAVLAVFVLGSCDDFYSTSWGTVRSYDSSKIALSEGNLKEWKKRAVGNPKLAKTLVEKIINDLDGKSGAERAAFQSAGIEFAIEQSGMGVKILELAGSDLSKIDSQEGVTNLLKKVQDGLSSVKSAADNIAAIANKSDIINEDGKPEFDPADPYGKTADPSNVGLAVMVLALAEFPDIDTEKDLLEQIPDLRLTGESPPVKIVEESQPTDNEIVLAAYLNLIAKDNTDRFNNNPITKGIRSAFLSGGK
ncbi:MAG: hypothetical protein LBL31_08075 [Spirochaetaceae bacterium]|nr:hypothetical protein [Spirochaetaceae bacterium]